MAPSTQIHIRDVRLSFIWAETRLDFLTTSPPFDWPLSFLGHRWAYAREFERALAGQPVPDKASLPEEGAVLSGLTPPWPKTGRHSFWRYYLNKRRLHRLSGNEAWNALVPLRGPVPATVALPDEGWRLTAESFVYPCGIGLVISATYRGDAVLPDLVDTVVALATEPRLQVKWHAPGSPQAPQELNLGQFADAALDRLRRAAWGPQIDPGTPVALEPFTVVTSVHGSGVDPEEAVAQGGDVHRALEALTDWEIAWRKTDQLPDLSQPDVNLPKFRTSKGGVLYARTRGRAVWLPRLFTLAPGTKVHKLGCYHRNLVLVSLQVESLAGLMLRVTEHLEDLARSEPLADCARHAAIILGRLYEGAPSTYRSYSPRAQIEQNDGWLEAINAVRDYFNLAPLA